MRIFFPLLLLTSLLLAACAGGERVADLPADVLYNRAAEALDSSDYEKTEEWIRILREQHPFSPRAVDAELLRAEMLYQQDDFEGAAAAYRAFDELHPGHPRAEYALYRAGKCHEERLLSADRDQSATRDMIDAFARLLGAYPEGEHAAEARGLMARGRSLLAEHEMKVARYYLKEKKYQAAITRFELVANTYADTPFRDEALRLALETRAKL